MPDFPAVSGPISVPRRIKHRYSISMLDHRGKRRAASVTMNPLATVAMLNAIRTAVGQASNAAVIETNSTSTEYILNVAARAVVTFDEGYSTIDHVAVMIYQDNTGTVVDLEIPAPDLSLFEPDGETIDPSNARVAAINTAVLAALNVGDPTVTPPIPNGSFAFVRGYLSTRAGERCRPRILPGGGVIEPSGGQLPPSDPGV